LRNPYVVSSSQCYCTIAKRSETSRLWDVEYGFISTNFVNENTVKLPILQYMVSSFPSLVIFNQFVLIFVGEILKEIFITFRAALMIFR